MIGCCVNFLDHTCFYTKNGQKLEVAFRDLDRKEGVGKSPTKLYPCVGLRTPGEEIEANFGQTCVLDTVSPGGSLALAFTSPARYLVVFRTKLTFNLTCPSTTTFLHVGRLCSILSPRSAN